MPRRTGGPAVFRVPFAILLLGVACGCANPPPSVEEGAPAPGVRVESTGHRHGAGDPTEAAEAAEAARPLPGRATVHHRFDDADRWARRFENPGRDAWQRPERVVELLELREDSKIADIGAATGYFPVRFARVATRGVVYGVDIEAAMVNYLNLRALREELPNLVSLVCDPDDPRIPEAVDVIFICNTYHHIDDRIAYFERLQSSLREGGRLVIVDFRKGDLPVGPKDEHKLAATAVVEELRAAGYRLELREELPYQYLLILTPSTSGPAQE